MNIRLRRKQIPNCNLPEVEMNQSFVKKVCAWSLGTTVSQPQAHMPLPFARAAHRAAGCPSAQDAQQSRSHVASAGFAQLRRSPQPALSICASSRINDEHGGFSIWHCWTDSLGTTFSSGHGLPTYASPCRVDAKWILHRGIWFHKELRTSSKSWLEKQTQEERIQKRSPECTDNTV